MGRDRGLALRRAKKPVGAWGKVLQSAFVASASNAEGCGLDCLWPIQSATSRSEIRRVLAAPSIVRVRPLVGSLHRRGRLQSAGLGERS